MLSTLLLASCATTPEGPFDTIAGEWKERIELPSGKTTSSRVTVIDATRGSFVNQNGIRGRFEGYPVDDQRMWKSYWIIDQGANACATKKDGSPYWGETVVQVNETNDRYKGYWNICGEGARYSVTGRR